MQLRFYRNSRCATTNPFQALSKKISPKFPLHLLPFPQPDHGLMMGLGATVAKVWMMAPSLLGSWGTVRPMIVKARIVNSRKCYLEAEEDDPTLGMKMERIQTDKAHTIFFFHIFCRIQKRIRIAWILKQVQIISNTNKNKKWSDTNKETSFSWNTKNNSTSNRNKYQHI